MGAYKDSDTFSGESNLYLQVNLSFALIFMAIDLCGYIFSGTTRIAKTTYIPELYYQVSALYEFTIAPERDDGPLCNCASGPVVRVMVDNDAAVVGLAIHLEDCLCSSNKTALSFQ